ncbi:MAG: hypothetical protein ACI4B9_03495 [Eggerthellaceae bacterium]
MLGTLSRFIRGNAVLAVSFVCAVVTVAFVPSDAQYAGYFDWKTLAYRSRSRMDAWWACRGFCAFRSCSECAAALY